MTSAWSCPAARLVLRADAPREQWLAERTHGIGGSDVVSLVGLSPYGSPYEVWRSKVEPVADHEPTEAMRRGSRLEPVLAQWFAEGSGLQVRRAGLMARRDCDHHRVSVDRLTADNGILELKTNAGWSAEAREWQDSGHSRRAYAQAQWGAWVTGREVVWCAGLVGVEWFVSGPHPRDEPLIERMRAAADRLWHHVLDGTPPPADPATIDADEVAARWPVLDPDDTQDLAGDDAEQAAMWAEQLAAVEADYADAGAEQRRIEKVRDRLRTSLAALAQGRGTLAAAGTPVARWSVTTKAGKPLAERLDTAALRAAHPDIAAAFMRPAHPRFSLLWSPDDH